MSGFKIKIQKPSENRTLYRKHKKFDFFLSSFWMANCKMGWNLFVCLDSILWNYHERLRPPLLSLEPTKGVVLSIIFNQSWRFHLDKMAVRREIYIFGLFILRLAALVQLKSVHFSSEKDRIWAQSWFEHDTKFFAFVDSWVVRFVWVGGHLKYIDRVW